MIPTRMLGCLAALALIPSCAGGPRAPRFEATPDASALLAALAETPAGEVYTASLFLEFEGGFLGEDRLRINGEIALEWPDRVRVMGAYGAFKKVFDLLVREARFQVFDHGEGVLFRGDAHDPEAARALGLAVRPGDIARLMRVGGTGPLEGARIARVRAERDTLRVAFALEDDDGRWEARFDPATLDLLALSRFASDGDGLEARYERYFGTDGRRVPRRVTLRRAGGDERISIRLRSIRFRDAIDSDVFEPGSPEGVEIVDL